MTLSQLADSVRAACPRGLWSQGVKLARDGAVSPEPTAAGEHVFRVAGTSAVANTVVLHPADGEWECDCAGRFDACAHVAAAVIAATSTTSAPSKPLARVAYSLGRSEGGLTLSRWLVRGDAREALPRSLMSLVSQVEHDVLPTQADLEIDRALGGSPSLTVPASAIERVFTSLAGCDRVTLDGEAIAIALEPLAPRGLVVDHGSGVRLMVVAHPAIDEIVADGVARVDTTLHPLGQIAVTGARNEALPLVRDYPAEELGELVTGMLPALERDIEVEVQSQRLPSATREARPRIAFELSGDGLELTVLPTLVYGDPPLCRIDGDRMVQLRSPAPVRDRALEKRMIHELRDELHLAPGRKLTLRGADAQKLLVRLRAFERGEAGAPETRVREHVIESPVELRLTVREPAGGTEVDLWFELPADDGAGRPRRASAAAVMAAWQSGAELCPLLEGGWAPIPSDFLARHGSAVADLLAAREARAALSPAILPTLGLLCDALDQPRPRGLARLAPLLEGFDGLPPVVLPPGLTATLRPYQEVAVRWLTMLRELGMGGILADDMGLGKTLETLCALATPALVVSPTSVVHNWAAEIARFRPDLTVAVYHGPDRTLVPADVTLTSYSILRLDLDALTAHGFTTVVLDEAQAIKNPDSQVARAAFALPAPFRLALSGTPVENRLDELWSLSNFTNPGLFGSRRDFGRRYATPIGAGDATAAAHLRARLKPFVLRRLKHDVAPELPPRSETVLYVELDEAEQTLYQAVLAATRADVVARLAAGASVMAVLEALLRLRQAACHPALVPGHSADRSSKITLLTETLSTAVADGHRALVFSQWTSLLDLIEPELTAAGIGFLRIDGSTRDRAGVVRGFQDPAGPPVLLSSLKAGGTGLNLTAADHVFLVDPWWNPAAEAQAADRAHRIGQDRPVLIHRLVARGTVEERILALQDQKRALAEAALAGGGAAGGLSRADLLGLLD